MRIINIGSCRQDSLDNHFITFHVNKKISYPHYSKEILEVIKFCKFGNISPDETTYMFRTAMLNKSPINFTNQLKENFEMGDVYVIEISSNRVYEYNNKFLHHIVMDTISDENIKKQVSIRFQNKDEIEEDIIEIMNLLQKPIVIVSHLITMNEGRRYELSEWLREICEKHNIIYINPIEEFVKNNISLNETIIEEEKLSHYSPQGHKEIGNIYYNIISKINIK
jgi:hypothetical protein